MKIIKGDLIKLACGEEFDVIAHGCNCFCKQKSGIARQMVEYFNTNSPLLFPSEAYINTGNIGKLGNIEFYADYIGTTTTVVNCYTQYRYGTNHPDGVYKPIDYNALALCMKKINHEFKGKKVGLPWIGCGLAGGDKEVVKGIFEKYLQDVELTIVEL